MKLTALLTFICMSTMAYAQTFVSVQDGSWEDGATWGNTSPGTSGVDYPDNNDNVIISGGTTVTNTTVERPRLVEIENGANLVSSNTLIVRGRYTINGEHSGSGSVRLQGQNDTISGSGLISTTTLFRVDVKRVIIPGSDITRINSHMRVPNNDTLINQGTLTLDAVSLNGNSTGNFMNDVGATLHVSRNLLNNGTLLASALNNEIIYDREGNGNQNIKPSFDGYYNLTIDGTSLNSQKRLNADELILNDLTIIESRFIPQDSYNIQIRGDLLNQGGMFDVMTNQARVVMDGGAVQQISGGADLYSLETANTGGGVTIVGDTVFIRDHVTVSLGELATSNLLKLRSDATGDARIAESNGNITGDVHVLRYIDAGETGWRFLCAPVQNATFEQWNDDFITSGFPGTDFPNYYFASIRSYDESVAGHQDSGLVTPADITDQIVSTTGYWVYCGDNLNGTQPFTIDVSGPVNVGDVSIPVDYSFSFSGNDADGWNLIANPYACPIDWDAATGWSKLFIDDAIYVWNTDLNQYSSFVAGVGTNDGSNIVAPCQAFYVKASFLFPSLDISESCKHNTSTPGFLRSRTVTDPVLRLSAAIAEGIETETVFRLNTESSNQFDERFDAYHIENAQAAIQFYSQIESTSYSINTLNSEKADTIQLVISAAQWPIEITHNRNEYAEDYCFALWDREYNDFYFLDNTSASIWFEKGDFDAASRFSLVIQPIAAMEYTVCDIPAGAHLSHSLAYDDKAFVVDKMNRVVQLPQKAVGQPVQLHAANGSCVFNGQPRENRISLGSTLPAGAYFLQIDRQKPIKIVFP